MATKKSKTTSESTSAKPKKKTAASKASASASTATAGKAKKKAVTKTAAKNVVASIEPSSVVEGGKGDGAVVLVTGATGFLGRHIVDALVAGGYRVRALCRSDDAELVAQGVEVVRGDVTDRASIDAAMQSVAYVVHAAGSVSRETSSGRGWMMQVHVAGTRHVVESACAASVTRVVLVSTSGTVAVGTDAELVYHEDDPLPLGTIHKWPYYLSKFLSERAANDAIRHCDAATELVTLNPSLALGPGDRRASSTGDVKRFLDRQIPVIPQGGLSFVDVRDVAMATVAALTKGRTGERYLLGALNCTCADFFARVGEVSGVAGPMLSVPVPRKFASFGVGLLEKAANLVGAKPAVTQVDADMAAHYWYVDSRKAEEELGFLPRPPMETLLDTVRDLRGAPARERFVGRGDGQ